VAKSSPVEQLIQEYLKKKTTPQNFFVGCMSKLSEEDCGELDASREVVPVDADEDEWPTNGTQCRGATIFHSFFPFQ
jgi:cytochrome c553